MLGMPLVGWALVSASPLNIPTVLYGVLPWPHLPVFSTLPNKAPVEATLKLVHAYGAFVLIAVVLLHAAAALRHHVVLRDDVLRRMIPGLPWIGTAQPKRLPMRRSTLVLATLLGFGFVGSAHAASWTIDKAKSTLGFTASQSGTPFTGRFKTWDATIDFDPANPGAAHIVATIDVASATTGDAQKDEAMPQEDWFAADKFAKATFEATGFTAKGGDAYETTGKLTLRGIDQGRDPAVLADDRGRSGARDRQGEARAHRFRGRPRVLEQRRHGRARRLGRRRSRRDQEVGRRAHQGSHSERPVAFFTLWPHIRCSWTTCSDSERVPFATPGWKFYVASSSALGSGQWLTFKGEPGGMWRSTKPKTGSFDHFR